MLQSEGSHLLLYNTVYNILLLSISVKFRKHTDRSILGHQFVEDSYEMELLCYQNMPYGLEILTTLRRSIVESYRIDEVLTDSTFKPNKECLELFV